MRNSAFTDLKNISVDPSFMVNKDNPKDYADNEDARKYDARLRGPVDPVPPLTRPCLPWLEGTPNRSSHRNEKLHCQREWWMGNFNSLYPYLALQSNRYPSSRPERR